MVAPSLPSYQSAVAAKEGLQPYIRTLDEAIASVPNGIRRPSPNQIPVLKARWALQVCLTAVRPILPSRYDRLRNR
jgi:hypothetical protein